MHHLERHSGKDAFCALGFNNKLYWFLLYLSNQVLFKGIALILTAEGCCTLFSPSEQPYPWRGARVTAARPVRNTGNNHQPNLKLPRLGGDQYENCISLFSALWSSCFWSWRKSCSPRSQRLALGRVGCSSSQAPTPAIALVLSCSHWTMNVLYWAVILGAEYKWLEGRMC